MRRVLHSLPIFFIKHLPIFVIRQPERTFLALVGFFLAASNIQYLIDTDDNQSNIPDIILMQWVIGFGLSGLSTLIGMYRSSKGSTPGKKYNARNLFSGVSLERLGALLLAVTSLSYVVIEQTSSNMQWPIAAIFYGLSLANVLRLTISTVGLRIIESNDRRAQ
jgi:hypothetical protein